ncbi:MAG TPA: hypothetical protein VIF10_00505 [Methylobacter sp.]
MLGIPVVLLGFADGFAVTRACCNKIQMDQKCFTTGSIMKNTAGICGISIGIGHSVNNKNPYKTGERNERVG